MSKIYQFADEEQRNLFYQAINSDSCLWAKVVMPHIVKEVPDFHKEIYASLDKNYKYSGYVLARGLAKSTISHTIQTTRDICHRREPHTVLISETVDQATADLVSIQDELINNEIIHELYGNLKGDIWNVQSMECANGCYVQCKGYTSRVRGAKWKNQRPTKIILDDFESEQNCSTHEQREEVKNWISARVEPSTDVTSSKIQYWGTIVHPESFLASIKDLASFKPPLGFYYESPIEVDGKPVWPNRYPMSWINQEMQKYKERNRMALYYQEYYNIPALTGNPRFCVDMVIEASVKFDKISGITFISGPSGKKVPVNVFIGVDPASSLSDNADNTNMCVVAVLPYKQGQPKRFIILDILSAKLSPTQQRDELFKLAEKYSPKTVVIETQGYQFALEDMCREAMTSRGVYFPIKPFKSNVSKSKKWLLGLEPYINGGNISRASNLKNWDLLRKELLSYNENRRSHDDTIDGLYLAIQESYASADFDVDDFVLAQKRNTTSGANAANWYTM